jgi:hypothetical protein
MPSPAKRSRRALCGWRKYAPLADPRLGEDSAVEGVHSNGHTHRRCDRVATCHPGLPMTRSTVRFGSSQS